LTPPIPEELPPEFLRGLKTAVAEIPGRAGDPKQAEAEAVFRRSGFDPLFRRIRMTRPKDCPMDRPMDVPISPAPDRDSTFSVGTAEPGEPDLTEIKSLLASSFAPLTGCLPTEKELGEILARGEILAAREGLTGELAGVLHLRSLRGAAEIRHLAVDPKFRRRGAGQKLVGEFLARTAGLRALVWLREDNAPASALYASAGFAPDGWTSAVLCRRQEI
ncbi:MAG: GNAT family N-acetyltransferase, partial [Clostridia bacterium]|nr:GNAT family N-acetyltransferase [Clostridia bacterium]